MIRIVYLGKNLKTQERLKYIPGHTVKFTSTYKDAAEVCTTNLTDEHFIVFYERSVRNEDLTAITYLRKKFENLYIILITGPLSSQDRLIYQNCGINDTLDVDATITEFNITPERYILRIQW